MTPLDRAIEMVRLRKSRWRNDRLFSMETAAAEIEREMLLIRDASQAVATHHPGTDRAGHPVSECVDRGCKL